MKGWFPLLLILLASCSKDPAYKRLRDHLDHSSYFETKFNTPQEVTKACLECHENAAKQVMKTPHWKWHGDPVKVPGHKGKIAIGKKNLMNNFCLGIVGNWASCTKCHAGYGWKDQSYDFSKEENVDCLICHDGSGEYRKGKAGMPIKGLDLNKIAKKVAAPNRENCAICHNYGGGGHAVKHGDLDNSLANPSEYIDVHMGRHKMLCTDCHKTEEHQIMGRSISVSVDNKNRVRCTDCHEQNLHKDERINLHTERVACATCHLPTYSRKEATKVYWDWSKAGDRKRRDDPHEYLKMKGEFKYAKGLVPEYYWFDLTSSRYLLRDKIDPTKVVHINYPGGDRQTKGAKIWPFKVHRGKQPYDKKNFHLLPPVTAGKGGYWKEFNWDKAFRLGSDFWNVDYSGSYDFVETDMYWPLSHMITPKSQALRCNDCHGKEGRMNWKALGYEGDPQRVGGQK